MKKIYIVGCAKSGTTLLRRMFWAYQNMWVIKDEIGLEQFAVLDNSKIGEFESVVGKRTWNTLFSSSRITDVDVRRHLYFIESQEIKVVNIVRDGRDVVESYRKDWGIFNPFEWMECLRQAEQYADHIALTVKYEDLLVRPDAVQKEIAAAFELTSLHDFADYPNFVNEEDDHKTYRLRPLTTEHIGKSADGYKQRPNDVEFFDELLKEYGYL